MPTGLIGRLAVDEAAWNELGKERGNLIPRDVAWHSRSPSFAPKKVCTFACCVHFRTGGANRSTESKSRETLNGSRERQRTVV